MSDYITENIGGAVVTRLAIPAPAPVIVPTISSRQGKHALANAGLYHPALAAIAALPEPARTRAQIDWEAAYWDRANATLIAMATALGLGPVELDDLFAQAATL